MPGEADECRGQERRIRRHQLQQLWPYAKEENQNIVGQPRAVLNPRIRTGHDEPHLGGRIENHAHDALDPLDGERLQRVRPGVRGTMAGGVDEGVEIGRTEPYRAG